MAENDPISVGGQTVYDHPVWRCKECGKIYHKEPVGPKPLWGKNKAGYVVQIYRSMILCGDCGGDIERAWNLVPLAKTIRPVPPIKGQDYRMWRYCCWSCGKGSEIAHGSRRRRWYRPTPQLPPTWTTDRCHTCGKENRLVFNLDV